jgi:hypothetical protein
MTWWWLSFADESGFLGACIVGRCGNVVDAVKTAHVFGCNPGGEVRGLPISDESMRGVDERDRFRLMGKAEMPRFKASLVARDDA